MKEKIQDPFQAVTIPCPGAPSLSLFFRQLQLPNERKEMEREMVLFDKESNLLFLK